MIQTGSQGLVEESQNLRRQLIDYLSTPEQEAIHEELRKKADEEINKRSVRMKNYYPPANPFLPPTRHSAPVSAYPTAYVSPNLTPSTSARPEPNPFGLKDYPIFVPAEPSDDELPSVQPQDSDTDFILNQNPTPPISSDDEAQSKHKTAPEPVAEPVPEPVLEPVRFPAPVPSPTSSEPSEQTFSEQPQPTFHYPFSEPTPRRMEPRKPLNPPPENPNPNRELQKALCGPVELVPVPQKDNLYDNCSGEEKRSWRDKEDVLDLIVRAQGAKVAEIAMLQKLKNENIKADGSPKDSILALYFVLCQTRSFCREEDELRQVVLEFMSYESEEDLWMNDIIPTHRQNTADFRDDEAAAIKECKTLAEEMRAQAEELAVRRITSVFDNVADVSFTDAANFAKNKLRTLMPIILERAKATLSRLQTERHLASKKTLPKPKQFTSAKPPSLGAVKAQRGQGPSAASRYTADHIVRSLH
jgi:hypothetical protein